jgi:uncharacterized protein (DUF2147 family)
VCTRLSGEPATPAPTVGSVISAQSAGDAWPAPTITRPHRTVRVEATVKFAKEGKKLCIVHVRCAHGQKTTIAYQMELQRLLAVLGL